MPLQVVEAVASFGGFSRTHAAPIGYTCTPKSLIYKHSIIILIFQGTQRKAYKNICLMLAAGIEQAKRAQPAPLKYIYLLLLASFSHSKPNKISFAKSSFISIFSSLSMISIIRILHTQTNYNIMEQNAL